MSTADDDMHDRHGLPPRPPTPSTADPAPADEDRLRREIERLCDEMEDNALALHPRSDQRHGMLRVVGKVRAALDRTAAPATDRARPEATP